MPSLLSLMLKQNAGQEGASKYKTSLALIGLEDKIDFDLDRKDISTEVLAKFDTLKDPLGFVKNYFDGYGFLLKVRLSIVGTGRR